jgi:hypothetical protein
LIAEIKTKRKPRLLGQTSEDNTPFYLTEEDRDSHIHILGATRQGKSKLLEMLIRQDVQRGYGACLLDPTGNAETMYNILRWCIQQDFQKVCIIEPHDVSSHGKFGYVPVIVPKQNLTRTIRLAFQTTEPTHRIDRYLPSLFLALKSAGLSFAELENFTAQDNFLYQKRRNQIMLAAKTLAFKHKANIDHVFRTSSIFTKEFETTVNRIQPFCDYPLKYIFGATEGGIPFATMIRDGWVILCNLFTDGVGGGYDDIHQRILGTMVMNEIMYEISSMVHGGWEGRFYLYVDEAGYYATRDISNVLDLKSKFGLKIAVAHQRFTQFEDPYVRSAIKAGANIKFCFQTPDDGDALQMIRLMYGGELADRQVSYVIRQLAQRQVAVKNNKAPSVLIKLRDVPTASEITQKEVDAFKLKIYERDPWYRKTDQLTNEIHARFKPDQSGGGVGKPKSNNAPGVEIERTDDGHTVVKVTTRKQAGRSSNLPAKPEAQSVPAALIHERPQNAQPLERRGVESPPAKKE